MYVSRLQNPPTIQQTEYSHATQQYVRITTLRIIPNTVYFHILTFVETTGTTVHIEAQTRVGERYQVFGWTNWAGS